MKPLRSIFLGVGTTYGYHPDRNLASLAHAFPGSPANDISILLTKNAFDGIAQKAVANGAYVFHPLRECPHVEGLWQRSRTQTLENNR